MGVRLGCAAAVVGVLACVGAVLFVLNRPPALPPEGHGSKARDLGAAALGVTELEGIWQQVNADEAWQFEFRRYTLIERSGPNRVEKRRSPFRLRTSVTPRQIDWGDGTVFGIYRLEAADQMTLCFREGTSPADRPGTFEAEEDKTRLFVMRRVGR